MICKSYCVRSTDENVGGSVVVGFWVSEVICRSYNVWSADENVGGPVVFVLFCFRRSICCFCCGPWRQVYIYYLVHYIW